MSDNLTTGRALALERLLAEDAIMLPQYRKMGGRGIFLAKALNRPFDFVRQDDAYAKSLDFLPSINWNAKLLEVGGKTLVWNQHVSLVADEWAALRGSISVADGILTYTTTGLGGSVAGNKIYTTGDGAFVTAIGHKIFACADVRLSEDRTISLFASAATSTSGKGAARYYKAVPAGVWTKLQAVVTVVDTSAAGKISLQILYQNVGTVGATMEVKNAMCCDLTAMFGAGNEPTTVEQFRAMFPDEYYAYDTGSLLSAGVTSIVSKDADAVTLDTYAIPAAVQALTGYGWSAGDVYNYVDFADKKFVQAVGSRAYASGDESDTSVITDGTTTYYALDTPVETDISAYLTGDNVMDVESGGSLTFENQHEGAYNIPVPSKVEYIRRLPEEG